MGAIESDADATKGALADTILRLLDARGHTATICPSEAARAVHAAQGAGPAEGWRELMGPARAVATRLVASGHVETTQRGTVVDPRTARGAIRIRRVRTPG